MFRTTGPLRGHCHLSTSGMDLVSKLHSGVDGGLVAKSCPTLVTPSEGCGLHSCVARQAPLSMGFPRQEYGSGLPCPFPGDLPDPGTEPESPALQVDSLLLHHLRRPHT